MKVKEAPEKTKPNESEPDRYAEWIVKSWIARHVHEDTPEGDLAREIACRRAWRTGDGGLEITLTLGGTP